jgi:hypothetical protein
MSLKRGKQYMCTIIHSMRHALPGDTNEHNLRAWLG